MRTLTSLSMPLVLPKLVTVIGSMDLKEGGKTLGRVLLFYAAFNIVIETSGVLIFHAVLPYSKEVLTSSSINKTQPAEVASHLPLSFAMQDLAFNLVPDNVFTAPFRRFRTHVNEVEGKMTYSDGFSLANMIFVNFSPRVKILAQFFSTPNVQLYTKLYNLSTKMYKFPLK